MVVCDQEDPAVLVEVGGGEVADDAVRHEQAVGGAQQRAGVIDDGGRGLGEAQTDAGSLLVHDAGEFGAEDRDGVVGGDQLELPGLDRRVEVGLAGEQALQDVVSRRGAVEEDLSEGGEFIVPAHPREQVVVEVAAQPGQGGAHGGLAEPDALSGAGDVALLQERTQCDDEVEVQTGQVHRFSPCDMAPTRVN